MSPRMIFDAVSEAAPGRKWRARWERSWPDYEAWFHARGGDDGPSRAACEAALAEYMPEVAPIHRRLTCLAGGSDRAARFLSGWCPPPYLGACTLAALSQGGEVRLVRNYDLSPDLNEGLLLRTEWVRPVMGMVEFLWGLSDGMNDAGLSVALAYGGSREVRRGFGITHILRHVLESCATVPEAVGRLKRVPSHMAYNVVLADAEGRTVSVELAPGGGLTRMNEAVAANHQARPGLAGGIGAPTSRERRDFARLLLGSDIEPRGLAERFLGAPLRQTAFDAGFGTLFTADYDPVRRRLGLLWPEGRWTQSLHAFEEGSRSVDLGAGRAESEARSPSCGRSAAEWVRFGMEIARRYGFEAGRGAWIDGSPMR